MSNLVVAQEVHVDVTANECKVATDSLFVKMTISGSINDLNSRDAILFTPYVLNSTQSLNLPYIQLNGKYKHILHDRNKKLKNRLGNTSTTVSDYVQRLNADGKFDIEYKVAVAKEQWMMIGAELKIKCESIDSKDEITKISDLKVQAIGGANEIPLIVNSQLAKTTNAITQTAENSRNGNPSYNYRGSYVSPATDAMDERNQRDLNFSLEEAQIMVNINPQILSLKELFTVAMSYKEDKTKFYSIISTCVKLYPTHPVANLNAASMAIELGDVIAANKYLQIAPYESLAYKNCRGTYELMSGNIYEGIRLLKGAKSEGSEEAAYNLDMFFKSNK